MKIIINYKTIGSLLWEKKFKLGFFAMLVWQLLLMKYDMGSVKFLPRLVSLTFMALSLDAALFAFMFLFTKRRDFYKPAFFAFLIANIGLYTTLNYIDTYNYFGTILDILIVKHIIPVHFVQVAVSDGNLFWVLMLGLYISIFLFIYGNWFIRHKKLEDGFWKIERQVFYTGLGLYGILVPFIFIFTHFTFVGSNYIYMEGLLKYTDKMVDIYDARDQKDNFQLNELHYFKTLDDVKIYYTNSFLVNRIDTGKNKKEFYDVAMTKINNLNKGFQPQEVLTYNKITRFHDWIQVAYNLSFNGVSVEQKKLWFLEITPTVIRAKEEYEEVLRHSILYVKEAKSGGYYVYFSLDRVFKDHHMNYIFNVFFILFHLVYVGFFIYLIRIHQKKRLSQKYKVTV